MSDTNKDKRKEHMARRKEHGVTYREMQEDFGVSKSKIHRDLNQARQDMVTEE